MHSFDPQIASRVGVNAAVLYQNILFWTRKNLANGRNVEDDKVWTYNSVKAWADLFPYLSADQVRRALAKLVDEGMIFEGNFNQSAYDRTKWYGVSCQLHLAETTNGVGQNHEPIPDGKPDHKPDHKPDLKPTPLPPRGDDGFDEFYAAFPRKKDPKKARAAYAKAIKKVSPDVILAAAQQYAIEREGKDPQYTKHPTSWLNAGSWENEPDPSQQDFHKRISQALGENDGLQPAHQIDHSPNQRLFAALQAPGSSGPRDGAGRDERDGRGNQPAYPFSIKPRRFGGAD